MDSLGNEEFIRFKIGNYNIGVIHKPPENMEEFFKKNDLQILIHGHLHYSNIQGTNFKGLIINPGSPTDPKPAPQKRGFDKPQARPTVITLEIDEDDLLSTYIITLRI